VLGETFINLFSSKLLKAGNGLTINGCIGDSGGSSCRGDRRRGSSGSNSWGGQDVLHKIVCLAKYSLRGIQEVEMRKGLTVEMLVTMTVAVDTEVTLELAVLVTVGDTLTVAVEVTVVPL
jgi:hypothetical protein